MNSSKTNLNLETKTGKNADLIDQKIGKIPSPIFFWCGLIYVLSVILVIAIFLFVKL